MPLKNVEINKSRLGRSTINISNKTNIPRVSKRCGKMRESLEQEKWPMKNYASLSCQQEILVTPADNIILYAINSVVDIQKQNS